MKNFTYLLFILFCCCISLSAQWSPTDGPYAASNAYQFAKSGARMALRTPNGVFVKNQSDPKWYQIDSTSNYLNKPINFGFVGDSLYYTTNYRLHFFSFNTFQRFSITDSNFIDYQAPLVIFNDTLMGVRFGGDVFLSTNYGVSNTLMHNGLNYDTLNNPSASYYVQGVFMQDNRILCFDNRGNNLFEFNRKAKRWEFLYHDNNTFNQVKMIYAFGGNIFVQTNNNIKKSVDNGQTWQTIYTITPNSQNYVSPHLSADNGTLYLISNSELKSSTNYGDTWINASQTGIDKKAYSTFNHILVNANEVFLIHTPHGLYKLNGNRWLREDMNGAFNPYLKGLSENNGRLLTNDSRGVFRLNFNQWNDVSPAPDSGFTYTNLVASRDTAYILAYNDRKMHTLNRKVHIYGTTDGGTSWTLINLPTFNLLGSFASWTIPEIFATNGGLVIYSEALDTLVLTKNYGTTYQYLTSKFSPSTRFASYSAPSEIEYYKGEYYALVKNKRNVVYKWDASVNEWKGDLKYLTQMGVGYNLIATDSLFYLKCERGVYVKVKHDDDWSSSYVNFNLGAAKGYDLHNYGLYLNFGNQIVFTENHGSTWHTMPNALPSSKSNGVNIYGRNVYASTNVLGVFKHSMPNVMHINEIQLGEHLKIFPNPSSGFFNISTPNNLPGHFTVYTLDGKKVLQDTFDQSQEIDCSILKHGLYLISIKYGTNTNVLKLYIN